MAVFRVHKTRDFTVMSNGFFRDMHLSLRAKGLLGEILTLPDNWDYTLAGLVKINPEGKDAISATLRELEQAGYLRRHQLVDSRGRFSRMEYNIYEVPQPVEEPMGENCVAGNRVSKKPTYDIQLPKKQAVESPLPESRDDEPAYLPQERLTYDDPWPAEPWTGNPPTVSPMAGSPPQLNKDIQNKDLQRTDKSNLFRADPEEAPYSPPTMQEEKRQETISYREFIKRAIDYDNILAQNPLDADVLEEILELLVETVSGQRKTIRVAGSEFPHEVVKARLLKLNGEHIQYVLDSLRRNNTQVRNMKQYLLAVLFNAPTTMHNSYNAMANYDLYGGQTV